MRDSTRENWNGHRSTGQYPRGRYWHAYIVNETVADRLVAPLWETVVTIVFGDNGRGTTSGDRIIANIYKLPFNRNFVEN